MKDFYTITKTSSGISQIPIDSKLFERRNIYIEGEITHTSAVLAVKQIQLLNLENREEPINLFISSHGGEITAGMLIYDAIQDSVCPINTICLGTAYSMAAVLVSSGSGKRYILPHSRMMLHEPLISSGVSGNASSIKELSDSLNNTKNEINEILAKHTGRNLEEVSEAASFDHYFSASDALNFGLVDRIIPISELWEAQ